MFLHAKVFEGLYSLLGKTKMMGEEEENN